ncbi:lytic transglycosylase domain-containing protein [uncultured Desulfuromusa sp.]|uniref:lytic transglycosylase domain-containing protein n=1 Tax=uncultured Desulfuromusa sp. TaxID=219183 RepID=UPI002AA6D126|nr:lytic transglycosylase domain-containing protein [uncultured Desulfuromusa sp.]
MSVDIAKIVGAFRAESPQKITSETAYEKSHKFTQVFDDSVNDLKSLENSKLQAAQIAKYSQLHLLHGLFSTDEERGEDDFFANLRQFESLEKTVAQKSHILDRYYATQQPSLLQPEQGDRREIDQMINHVAKKVSLAPELIHSVVAAESAYNPAAVSPVGAQGLMQLMPETAEELGVQDSFNPGQNLLGGSKYLKQLLDKYDGDLDSALAAYNWGQGNVDRHGLDKMPEETRHYLTKVKSRMGIQST